MQPLTSSTLTFHKSKEEKRQNSSTKFLTPILTSNWPLRDIKPDVGELKNKMTILCFSSIRLRVN